MSGHPAMLRTVLRCIAPAGIADALALASVRGPRLAHTIHLGGAFALLYAANRIVIDGEGAGP